MLFEMWMARRLSLRADTYNTQNRAGAGTVIAVIGIALSVAIMILSQAVVTGFKNEIKSKVVGFNSDITLYPDDAFTNNSSSQGILLTDSLRQTISQVCPDALPTLTIRQPAILKTDSAFQGIVMRGSAPGPGTEFIARHLVDGEMLPLQTNGVDSLVNTIVISRSMADALSLEPGSKINSHFIINNNLRTRRLTVRGIYDTHFNEYDAFFAYTTLEFLQNFNHVDSITGGAIEIWGIPLENIADVSRNLQNELAFLSYSSQNGKSYIVDNVLSTGAVYFNWLELLDTNVVVIITLMACVALFTLISSLFIIILERVNTIGLLKALGATNKSIRMIFICISERLVLKGLLFGNIISIAILLLQFRFHIIPLNADTYYINYVPVTISWLPVVLINLCAIIISAIMLILPSGAIARLKPAETMRFE